MGSSRRRQWPGERIHLQRAIMALALEVYPHWRTIPELAREIGHRGILTRAVLDLPRLGSPADQARRPHGAAETPVTPSSAATL
jgi:hypothetical protein